MFSLWIFLYDTLQLLDLWSYFWNKIFNKIDGGKRAANTSLALLLLCGGKTAGVRIVLHIKCSATQTFLY